MFSPAALPVLSLGGALPDAASGIIGEAPDSGAFAQLLSQQPAGHAAAMPSAASLLQSALATGPAKALPESGKNLPGALPVALPGAPQSTIGQLNLEAAAVPNPAAQAGLLPAKVTETAAFLARQFREAGEAADEAVPADPAPKEAPSGLPAQMRLAMMALGRQAKSRLSDGGDASPARVPVSASPDDETVPAPATDQQQAPANALISLVPVTVAASEARPGSASRKEEVLAARQSPAAPVTMPFANGGIPQSPEGQTKVAAGRPASTAPLEIALPRLPDVALTADSLPAITFEGDPIPETATSIVTMVRPQAGATVSTPMPAAAGIPDNGTSAFQSGAHGGNDGRPSSSHQATCHSGDSRVVSAATAPADLIAPDVPALVPAPVVLAENAGLATVPVTAPAQNERPADFTQIVDRLIAARDAAGTNGQIQPVQVSLLHAEFGKVSLRFEQDHQGLSVSMASADPAFAQAVQASAQVKAAQETTGDNMAGFANGQSSQRQSDGGSSQSGGFNPFNASGQSTGQSGNRQNFAGQRDNTSPAGNPTRDSDSGKSEPGPADRRRGLFA